MQNFKHLFIGLLSLTALSVSSVVQASQTVPAISPENSQGSLKPYPAPESLNQYPDSLTPVFINHVGRHGARYPAGPAHTVGLMKLL